LFHLFLFFHLSIGLLLFVCARAGEEKKAPLLVVVCPCGFKAEGRRKMTPKEGEKLEAEGRRKIEEAEGEKFRLLFPHNNELLKKQPTNEPSRRRGFRE
jgi:hypothetical protein